MADMDWSDLRYALAIGRLGSVAAAARQLGVNATTVQRRLDALEKRLGARLFDRARTGYLPTDAGHVVIDQARRMADQADEIERRVLGRDRELTGPLRVTTAFVVMEHLLPAPLAGFARAYPGIEVEVVENAFLVDLSRRSADSAQTWARLEADVAVRLSANVAEHLVGRQLGMTHCRVYAQRGAPDLPQTVTPLPVLLRDAPWVAFERDATSRVYDRWMRTQLAHARARRHLQRQGGDAAHRHRRRPAAHLHGGAPPRAGGGFRRGARAVGAGLDADPPGPAPDGARARLHAARGRRDGGTIARSLNDPAAPRGKPRCPARAAP